jgi:hypothetical protein
MVMGQKGEGARLIVDGNEEKATFSLNFNFKNQDF